MPKNGEKSTSEISSMVTFMAMGLLNLRTERSIKGFSTIIISNNMESTIIMTVQYLKLKGFKVQHMVTEYFSKKMKINRKENILMEKLSDSLLLIEMPH